MHVELLRQLNTTAAASTYMLSSCSLSLHDRAVLLLRSNLRSLKHSDKVEEVVCLIYLVIHKTRFSLNKSDFPAVDLFVEARQSNAAFIFIVQIMVGVASNR